MESFYNLNATTLEGAPFDFAQLKGKRVLIVNTASKCGFTPQYADLEKLHDTHGGDSFVILGFPCNQFGAQEPGSTADIVDFCTTRFQTTFPLFEKIDVNGDNAHPLYKHLKSTVKGIMGTERIKWNFTKFLINREGEVVARYGSQKKPADIAKDISSLL